MPDQPELRQRLADAITLHRPRRLLDDLKHEVCQQDCHYAAGDWYIHLVDVLLDLPGIAIAATGGDAMRWEALRERLERAAATLTAMACKARTEVADDAQQSTRLAGKVSGIRLALSYMQDEENLAAGVAEEQTNA